MDATAAFDKYGATMREVTLRRPPPPATGHKAVHTKHPPLPAKQLRPRLRASELRPRRPSCSRVCGSCSTGGVPFVKTPVCIVGCGLCKARVGGDQENAIHSPHPSFVFRARAGRSDTRWVAYGPASYRVALLHNGDKPLLVFIILSLGRTPKRTAHG